MLNESLSHTPTLSSKLNTLKDKDPCREKILEYLATCSEPRKNQLKKEYREVGDAEFFDRMARDICFRIWNGEISLWRIKQEILRNRRA